MSRRGLFKLVRLTLGGMVSCVAVAVAFVAIAFWRFDDEAFRMGMVVAVILPILIAGPLFVFMSLKIRELAQLNRELQYAASHDSLTTLLNRGAFTLRVNESLEEIGHVEGGRGALLLIDADFFKAINDRWGHSMGDTALREIAIRLAEVVRTGDIVGRLGGEEFGVFLPGAGLISANTTAERLRAVVAGMRLTTPTGEPLAVSISVGGIFFRNAITFEQMFQRADRMLYDAKANGRNRVEMEEFRPSAAELFAVA